MSDVNFNWVCAHCDQHVTITSDRYSSGEHRLWIANADGPRLFKTSYVVCPNEDCKKFTLRGALTTVNRNQNGRVVGEEEVLLSWNLIPDSTARVFPDYVPKQIRNDYVEACKIRDLSPKASATLSRRCLQGIIRDFWKVKAGNLKLEIEAIKDKVDLSIWEAIDAVRSIGNIGAHMEKDVDVIIDVEPEEAELLIQLIEQVIDESYVSRHEREQKMKKVVDAAAKKAEAKKNGAAKAVP